jgi:hypothetical protein
MSMCFHLPKELLVTLISISIQIGLYTNHFDQNERDWPGALVLINPKCDANIVWAAVNNPTLINIPNFSSIYR